MVLVVVKWTVRPEYAGHFHEAMGWMPEAIAAKPSIIHVPDAPGTGWQEMAELTPR